MKNVCWPMTGSGEIDVFEHHGDHQKIILQQVLSKA